MHNFQLQVPVLILPRVRYALATCAASHVPGGQWSNSTHISLPCACNTAPGVDFSISQHRLWHFNTALSMAPNIHNQSATTCPSWTKGSAVHADCRVSKPSSGNMTLAFDAGDMHICTPNPGSWPPELPHCDTCLSVCLCRCWRGEERVCGGWGEKGGRRKGGCVKDMFVCFILLYYHAVSNPLSYETGGKTLIPAMRSFLVTCPVDLYV